MTHTDREHAELSLSSSDRWVNCPGSIFLMRNIEAAPAGPEAARGTKVHELCEVTLSDFLMYKLRGSDPDARASLMAANYEPDEVQNAVGYKEAVWENVLNQSITNKAWGVEERFTFDEQLQIFGTVDFWAIFLDDRAKRCAALVDYKNGFNFVSEKSGQLKSYACALRREIRQAGKDVDYIRAAIYQPRCVSAPSYREASFSPKALDVWERKMVKAAHQIYVKQKPSFKVGTWCKWCPAKAICKKYAADIEKQTALKIIDPEQIVLPAPETLSDEQLAKIVLHSEMIESFLKSVAGFSLNRVLSGNKLPGIKCVLGSTRRKWISDEDTIKKQLQIMGLSEKDIWQKPKLATLTAIEKKIGKGTAAKAAMDMLTEETQAKPVLVPLVDPRVEVKDGLSLLSEIEPEE